MRRIHLSIIVAVLGVALAAPAAAQRFNDSSIKGTWALSVEGEVASGLINGLFAEGTRLFAIGRVIFDGKGMCKSDDQLVVGTASVPPAPGARRTATACTYKVQPDGYGVFFVTFENAPELDDGDDGVSTTTARFILENRKQMSFIADNTELGIFGGGTLVRRSGRIE